MKPSPDFRTAGLFAGIGGIETGLNSSSLDVVTDLLCENWEPAQAVLRSHFDVEIAPDVREMGSLPASVNLVTAGFPCTDLSQAGRTAGIGGSQSGLVAHVFHLLAKRRSKRNQIAWLVIENVQNMLALDGGRGMRYLADSLEALGYRWAYRVVDSRFAGVPQRRRRVILLASPTEDPRAVLFADDAGEPESDRYRDDGFGFYWTEGRGGLGWAQDAVPTLKGGSTIGIPSPPGIWLPRAEPGRALVVPSVEDAEVLQGFPRGWTAAADQGRRNGPRWKLVGNAVTVGVARWLGEQLASHGEFAAKESPWAGNGSWPAAAWGERSRVFRVDVSEYPCHDPYQHLCEVVDVEAARPLSFKGVRGFWNRLEPTGLGQHPGFRDAVVEHLETVDPLSGALSA